ncbi:PAS domain-containing protein [Pseudobacteriovorax antillogorgiicola]|uniref:histidine kinase n=1 Tax=Pseudobacteriovorax antillogorgiicola TaxID=1513793 RepID=A0A1Y6BFC1_9BACT|nr:PAS domain-containing protein [Pseudobacteriovorax antillogorgiicola]TCS56354.1 PAS domain S-box-containing protein [Pseudobacteriovorax antillogorgiicola]SMF06717.1 PAS domain S-box-containing protein [Pseudobacteriovorax antillogorgiicola]
MTSMSSPYMPHGHCYLWQTDLMSLHGISDSLIFLSYMVIPACLLHLLRSRQDLPTRSIFYLFIAFIFFCGVTHLIEVYSIWVPDYWLTGFFKAVTAGVSIVTAFICVRAVPHIEALPNIPESLAEARKELNRIVNNVSMGILALDEELRIEFANAAALNLTGLEEAQLYFANIDTLFEFKSRELLITKLGQISEEEGEQQLELHLLQSDGSLLPVLVNLSQAQTNRGLRHILCIEDRTTIKKQQQTILKLHEKLNEAIEGANHGVWSWSANSSQNTWWSDKLYELIGYQRSELSATFRSFLKTVYPQDRESVIKQLRDAVKSQVFKDIECRIKTGSGPFRWFLIRGQVNRNADGYQFSGTITDIHKHKILEVKVHEQNEILRFVQEETNDGWWDHGVSQNYMYMSPRFWATFGYDFKTRQHSPGEWDTIIHPEDREKSVTALRRHVNSKGRIPYRLTLRFLHQKGYYVSVICNGKVIEWDQDGHPARMVGSHTNVTKMVQYQDLLVELNGKLKSKNSELEDFAHVVSHDLRAPVRHIKQYAQFVLQNIDPSNPQVDYLNEHIQLIEKNAKKSLEMIRSLLVVSKLERDQVQWQSVSVEKVMAEVEDALLPKIEAAHAVIKVKGETSFYADPRLMERLFSNLVDNSIKYARQGIAPEIMVEAYLLGGSFVIDYRDNGIGIPEGFREKAFGLFEKGMESMAESMGIGLSICKKIVDMHHGTIDISSHDQQGTKFTIVLRKKDEKKSA